MLVVLSGEGRVVVAMEGRTLRREDVMENSSIGTYTCYWGGERREVVGKPKRK